MSGEPVVEIRGVTKAFGDEQVLKGIDLDIGEHEAVALIGASGSGKSTLLRCIDLLEEIDDGDILLDGEVITDPSVDPVAVRRRLGLVFQAYNLFPHLSVLDNVVLGITKAHGVGREEAEQSARAQLARFGLAGREEDDPDRLSGGQQQRVAIARAFAAQAPGDASRRGDQRPRPRAGRGGPRGRARAQGGGRDDDARDPRDGLRP